MCDEEINTILSGSRRLHGKEICRNSCHFIAELPIECIEKVWLHSTVLVLIREYSVILKLLNNQNIIYKILFLLEFFNLLVFYLMVKLIRFYKSPIFLAGLLCPYIFFVELFNKLLLAISTFAWNGGNGNVIPFCAKLINIF